MSASTSTETNGQRNPAPRKQLTKAQLKIRQEKSAATRAANAAAKAAATGTPPIVSTIQPTPARAAAMTLRANSAVHVTDEIAAGFAARLRSAGPDWTPEYQTQFMAGLSAALPVICAPKGSAAVAPASAKSPPIAKAA